MQDLHLIKTSSLSPYIWQIIAMQQIELCTAQAWFSEDKALEEEVLVYNIYNPLKS